MALFNFTYMGFHFSFGWGGAGKTPPVQVEQNGKRVFYKLTDHDLGEYQSCLRGGYSAANMIAIFESIPEVFAPIDAIATRVMNGRFSLRRTKTDEIVLDNDRWNKFIQRPNWRQSFKRFGYNAIVYKYTTGNRYFYKSIPEGLPRKFANVTSAWMLPPQYTDPIVKGNRTKIYKATEAGDVVQWYQCTWDGYDKFLPDVVRHDATFDFGNDISNNLKGIGVQRVCEMPMSNLIAVYQARNAIYVKRGALGAIVNKKEDESGSVTLTPDEKKNLRDEFQGTFGVTGGRDLFGITDVPVDFIRFGMSIEELQPFEETYADAAAIYGALGVPRSFIPTKDGPTYTNGPADERKLYQDVCIPDGEELAILLTDFLDLEAEGLYITVSYDHIAALQDDKDKQATTDKTNMENAKLLYDNNFITKNEFRVRIGLEEIDGGDVYAADGKNPDPLAVKLGVGGTQAMQAVVLSTMSAEAKKNFLIVVFGMSEEDAAKLSIENEQQSNPTA